MDKIRLAKSCSTCRMAMFRFPRQFSTFYNVRKKQLGICFLNCDGLPPKSARAPFALDGMDISLKSVGKHFDATGLDSARKWGVLLERREYLELAEKYIKKKRWVHFFKHETIESALLKISKYYNQWREYSDWWVDNWDYCRRCHRVTVCDQWEDAGNPRENVARQIVDGRHGLHED